jgi:hypothetical protein
MLGNVRTRMRNPHAPGEVRGTNAAAAVAPLAAAAFLFGISFGVLAR